MNGEKSIKKGNISFNTIKSAEYLTELNIFTIPDSYLDVVGSMEKKPTNSHSMQYTIDSRQSTINFSSTYCLLSIIYCLLYVPVRLRQYRSGD